MNTERLDVTFTLEEQDYVEFNIYHWRNSLTMKKQKLIAILL